MGDCFFVPLAIVVDRPWSLVVSLRSAIAAGTLAVVSTAGALLIYFRLLGTIGSMGVASQSYLHSAMAVTLGVLFLNESLTIKLVVGVSADIGGVILINTHSPLGGTRESQRRAHRRH